MSASHLFDPDDQGDCVQCPLPAGNRIHRVQVKAPIGRNEARVSHLHPETAHAAAAKALPRSGTQKARLYALIAERPHGATVDELEVLTGLTHQSASAAVNSLMRDNHIAPMLTDEIDPKTGQRRAKTRNTRSGHAALVWRPTVAPVAQDGAA